VVGRSLIVHAKPDDLSTQPSGSSGPRLACGLISRAP
jgi:Cu-Zn family superoxide dismutase